VPRAAGSETADRVMSQIRREASRSTAEQAK
jgi:hypothetical protein